MSCTWKTPHPTLSRLGSSCNRAFASPSGDAQARVTRRSDGVTLAMAERIVDSNLFVLGTTLEKR
eukprot:131232-Chlamydomonas_euryale.AAC.1